MKIINIRNLQEERGHCGQIRKLTGNREDISFTHLNVNISREHYHKKSAEFYYVLKGKGKIKLDDEIYDISEGDLIEILPNTRHNAFDEKDLEILIVAIPRLANNDHYFV